jgi:hypothetical protein
LTQKLFARACGLSERKLAELEGGAHPRAGQEQRLVELDRLRGSLAQVMRADAIGEWLVAPNPAFGGLKPLEVIERGEVDRLWRMVYELESGVPG